MFDSMKHSHRDVQVHMWDVQRNSSEQVFSHSFIIQEECDCNACVFVCATGKVKGCMFFTLSQVWPCTTSHKNRDLKVKKFLELVLQI